MLLTNTQKNFKVLRKGNKGKDVKQLQTLLNSFRGPKNPIRVDGDFGNKTEKAVKEMQKKANLVVDGIVGKNTWTALLSSRFKSQTHSKSSPQYKLASIAVPYVGTKETGDNRMGDDKKMKEIFQADDLVINGETDGYAWCAAFVSLCVQKLIASDPVFYGITPPREPSVNRFLTIWAKKQKCLIFKPNSKLFNPSVGDIVVFTFSHIGIVTEACGGSVKTIEGNTNSAGSRDGGSVRRKNRKLSLARAFIRLPIRVIDTNDGS